MNFKDWLINELNLSMVGWIDPDKIWNQSNRGVTFIYANKLYYFNDVTHARLIRLTPDLLQRYELKPSEAIDRDIGIEMGDLFGRIGNIIVPSYEGEFPRYNVVSFWNKDKSHYDNLGNCLNELKKHNLIPNEALISTPFGTEPISNNINTTNKKLSDEEIFDLYKKAHTINPMQKKDVMKQLGLVTPMKKNPWQKELEKTGINPGQKWWSPQSEGTK